MGIGTSKAGQSQGFRLTKLSAIELIVGLALLGLAGMLGYNAFTAFYFNMNLSDAMVKRATGFRPDAQKAAKTALEQQKTNPDASLLLGQLLHENGSSAEALLQLQTASTDTSAGDWLEMATSLAAALLSQEALAETNWESAQGLLEQVLTRDPSYATAHALMGQLRLNQGKYFGDGNAEQHFASAVSVWRSISTAPKLDFNDASFVPNLVMCAVAYNGLGMCAVESFRETGDPAKLLDAMQHFRSAMTYRMPWATPVINLERTGALYAHHQYTRLGTNAGQLGGVATTLGGIAPEFLYFQMHLTDRFTNVLFENPMMNPNEALIEANRAITNVIMVGFRMRQWAEMRPPDFNQKEMSIRGTLARSMQQAKLDFPTWNWFIANCEHFRSAGGSAQRNTSSAALQLAADSIVVSKLRVEEELALHVNLVASWAANPAQVSDYAQNPFGSKSFMDRWQRIKELLVDRDLPSDAQRPSAAWIQILDYLSAHPNGISMAIDRGVPTEWSQVAEPLRRCAAVTCYLPPAQVGANEIKANEDLMPRDASRYDPNFTPLAEQLTATEYEGAARAIAMYINWIDASLQGFRAPKTDSAHGLSAKIRVRLFEAFRQEPKLAPQALGIDIERVVPMCEKWNPNVWPW